MPTSLPTAYTSSIRSPFLTWLSTSFPYLAVPPLLTLFITIVIIGYGHPLFRTSERPLSFKWGIAVCDEMASCGLAETTSIRKTRHANPL